MKKDELYQKLGRFEERVDELESRDETQRRELCKALGLYKSKSGYASVEEVDVRSWFQIFVEIGRLKASDDVVSLAREAVDVAHRAASTVEYMVEMKRQDKDELV